MVLFLEAHRGDFWYSSRSLGGGKGGGLRFKKLESESWTFLRLFSSILFLVLYYYYYYYFFSFLFREEVKVFFLGGREFLLALYIPGVGRNSRTSAFVDSGDRKGSVVLWLLLSLVLCCLLGDVAKPWPTGEL